MAGASKFSAATPTHVRGRVAHYRVVEPLGEGGMGVVLLAHDETLDRNVALKLLSPRFADDVQFRGRFMRESRLAAAIDHPNIIPIFEAGDADGQLFIAMRYVAGVDLRELLASQGPFSVERTIALVDQMARALDAAHAAGLVHRDVKPGNVLIDRAEGREHCYLTDFGLTKNIASSSGYTETGELLGTLSYMAPEQIEGRHVDGRADLYALGCVMFECLTGVPPFRRDSDVAMMYAHLNEQPPSLSAMRPDLPADADTVIMRSLAKAPEDRHATCLDLVAELQATLAGVPVRPFVPSSLGNGRGRRRFARPVPTEAPTWSEPPRPPMPPVRSTAPAPPRLRPPRPAQLAPPPAGRGSLRAAVIVAVAILLTAGGIAAALLLRKDSNGPSRAEQQALVVRTKKLQQEVLDLRGRVGAAGAQNGALRKRIADEERNTHQLIGDLQAQQSEVNDSLVRANNQLLQALLALASYNRSGNPHQLVVFNQHFHRATSETQHAASMNNGPGRTPVSGANNKAHTSSTPEIHLPDRAKATISAPNDETIRSVTNVGDVVGDSTNDFAVVTDKAAYVVSGDTIGDLKLQSLTGDDRGSRLLGAKDVAPAGDFAAGGLVASTGASVYPVTDLSQPVDSEPSLGDAGISAGKAGDLNKDGTDDVAVADGNGTVTVHLSDGGTRSITGPAGFGKSLASVTDLNKDGYDDLLIGSPEENVAYVIYSTESTQDVDVSSLSSDQGSTITGPKDTAFGTSVADPGNGDVLVGAPNADPKGRAGAGAAYVIHAENAGGDVNVADGLGSGGYEIDGVNPNSHLGSTAASDRKADAILGTKANGDALAYIVPTRGSNDTVDLLKAPFAAGIHGAAVGTDVNLVAGGLGSSGTDVLVPAVDGHTAYVVPATP